MAAKYADDSRGAARAGTDFDKEERALFNKAQKLRDATASPGNTEKVTSQVVDIYSDGTRMSGTIWRPDGVSNPLPAVLLCHGWGGLRSQLDFQYAINFAKAGLVAVTFDYRTFGDSDGILLSEGPQPRPDADGMVNVRARVVRKIVDPEWQNRDIVSAMSFLRSLEGVDTSRIGIWGSSLGGGHVLKVAGGDGGIKCVVAQIGSIDTYTNWVSRHPDYRGEAEIAGLSGLHAQGSVLPWTMKPPYGLSAAPNLPKVVFEHRPLDGANNIKVPTLLLPAQDEDLYPNAQNSEKVFQLLCYFNDYVIATNMSL